MRRRVNRNKNGFSPLSLSPLAWFDANDPNTIAESGGVVTQWDSKSSALTMSNADATRRPSTGINTLNGKNVLTFNYDSLLLSESVTNKAFFLVVDYVQIGDNSSGSPDICPILGSDANNVDYVFVTDDVVISNYDISIDGAVSRTGAASVNNGTLTAGTNISLGLTNTTPHPPRIYYIQYNANASTRRFGEVLSGTTRRSRMRVGEFLLFSTPLTSDQTTEMYQYLSAKWGITIA